MDLLRECIENQEDTNYQRSGINASIDARIMAIQMHKKSEKK